MFKLAHVFGTFAGRSLSRVALFQALFILSQTVMAAVGAEAERPAGQLLSLKKVLVTDCRAVRGFIGSPIDGTVSSRDYRGVVREYPKTASDGVAYSFNNNDGLHLLLPDAEGFDLVVLRGGAKARLYKDCTTLVEPKGGDLLWTFEGGKPCQIAQFKNRIKARTVSLFGVTNGAVADVSFYRLGAPENKEATVTRLFPGKAVTLEPPQAEFATGNLFAAMKERYGDREHRVLELAQAHETGGLLFEPGRMIHFVTQPSLEQGGLTAVSIEGQITGTTGPCTLTCAIQDPLNPRLDLTYIRYAVPLSGEVRWLLDIPDQVLLPGARLWITLGADQKISFKGPDGQAPAFQLYTVGRERALPEALAWRKMLLKTLFSSLSEPRPWGAYRKQSREDFFRSNRYAQQCPELFMTIDQCYALAPGDDTVRQYREWVYLHNLDKLSEVTPPPPPPSGVPDWAWYPRLAWLETRRIAEWWLEHRLVETGEFGGRVGDDSDLYQQFADLPFFESDGVGERVRQAAARMAELAEKENLRGGLNRQSTDALHAYEEGINHLALMARWFYGDPLYVERCMESARNMEHLTIVTADGRRHFRDGQDMGARDMENPRPPKIDGHTTPLMWHTALQVADYNRNPRALKVMREWADSWLRVMKPGQWATAVEVTSGKVVDAEKERPLYGGYRSQGSVFMWLAALTGEKRYVEPFLYYCRQGKAPLPIGTYAGECFNLGFLDEPGIRNQRSLIQNNPELALYFDQDPTKLIQATIGKARSSDAGIESLYDARRWPDIYTKAEPFTDRVFLDLLQPASTAFLGGWTRRNKFNPTLAVSWEGFSTNYAALVLVNRQDRLKLAAYSFASVPTKGQMRIWALEHGRYRVTSGPAGSNTFAMVRTEHTSTLELARGDRLPLSLPPGRVTLLELRQLEKLDDILGRADLAITAREVVLKNNAVHGTIHNLGAVDAPEVELAVVDRANRLVSWKRVGPVPAPLDLVPKPVAFSIAVPVSLPLDCKLVIDPENKLAELNKANNEIVLQQLTKE